MKMEDRNGYWEKRGVLLSKVGIFPYLGAQLAGAPDPTRIYRVYRPAEELRKAAETFRLVPWVDEHEMLGPEEEGCTPPEEKGIHGVTGEQVYFEEGGTSEDNEHGGIRGNIKLFSEFLKGVIEKGKQALSLGYRSRYDWTPGVWNGEPFDVVQRDMKGNHLALCDKGRMGPEVTVFDHLDIKEFVKMEDDDKKTTDEATQDQATQDQEVTLEQLAEAIKTLGERLARLEAAGDAADAGDDEAGTGGDDSDAADDDAGTGGEDGEAGDDDGAAGDGDKQDGTGMDSALRRMDRRLARLEKNASHKQFLRQTARRDELVSKLTPLVGTFDHALMTADDVAAYGCKKLGIACGKGQESAALTGYLAAASRHTPPTFTFDAAPPRPGKALDRYLNGDK